ncbi:MAG: hypothetical protein AAFN70_01525, partial [Planctomycetota bacterium]
GGIDHHGFETENDQHDADLYVAADATAGDFIDPSSAPSTTMKTVQPKEWMPWTFLSVGAIILLYGVTLPKRWSGDDH